MTMIGLTGARQKAISTKQRTNIPFTCTTVLSVSAMITLWAITWYATEPNNHTPTALTVDFLG